MRKIFKWLVGLFLALGLLLAAGFYYLTHYFDINQFKDQIAHAVFDKTGRQFKIAGDIRWTLFPSIAIELKQVTLGNAPGFESDFLSADKIALQVDTRALFTKTLKIRSVEIKHPIINLQINAKGTNNWTDISQPHAASTIEPKESPSTTLAPLAFFEHFSLNQFQITEANLNFSDAPNKKTYEIHRFALLLTDVAPDQAFPFQCTADLIAHNPDLSATLDFSGKFQFNSNSGDSIHLTGATLKNTVLMPNKPVLHSTLDLAMEYAPVADNLTISRFQGTLLDMGEVDITGKIERLSHNPTASFSVSGKQLYTPSGLKIDALKTSLYYRNRVTDLPDLNLALYQGTYQGKLRIDHSQPALNITATGKLQQVSLGNLLKDVAGDIPLAGTLSAEHQLNTIGVTSADWIANLYGPLSLNLDNGIISGIDLSYIFALAKSKLDSKETARTDTGKTAIGYLTAKMMAEGGMIKNTELKFQGDNYETTGKGTVRLSDFYVDYDLTAAMTKTQSHSNEWLNTPIPIKVTGIPPNLKSLPNFSVLFDSLLKQQVQKQSKKLLNRLTEKYGENLGEGVNDAIERGLGDEIKNLPFGDVFKKE